MPEHGTWKYATFTSFYYLIGLSHIDNYNNRHIVHSCGVPVGSQVRQMGEFMVTCTRGLYSRHFISWRE